MSVAGAKYVRLYDRAQTPFLYRKPAARSKAASGGRSSSSPDAQGNSSAVGRHVEEPGALKCWPLLRQATYTETILQPGDGLYIPSGVWHYVRALDAHPSLSTNFWF